MLDPCGTLVPSILQNKRGKKERGNCIKDGEDDDDERVGKKQSRYDVNDDVDGRL